MLTAEISHDAGFAQIYYQGCNCSLARPDFHFECILYYLGLYERVINDYKCLYRWLINHTVVIDQL